MAIHSFVRLSSLIIFLLTIIHLQGCGGGSSDSGTTTAPVNSSLNTVNIAYSKGPVNGAEAHLLNESGIIVAGPVSTNAGVASFSEISYNGLVYATFSGGSYVDEATGNVISLPPTFIIRSGVGTIRGGVAIDLVATPLTEIGFKRAEIAGNGTADLSSVNTHITNVADEYGLDGINLTSVHPTPLSNINGSSEADRYGAVLSAISQQMFNDGNAPPSWDALSDYINSSSVSLDKAEFIKALDDLKINPNTSGYISINLVEQVAGNVGSTNDPIKYLLGGNVSGLNGSLILQNNGRDNLVISSNGLYSFNTQLLDGDPYNVTIVSQPQGQQCNISNATGNALGNIDTVNITCENLYSIGGVVTGLSGTLILQNNLTDEISINNSGPFTFPTSLIDGNEYSVTINEQPTNNICSISNASGLANQNIDNISIQCTEHFAINVEVNGLKSDLTLRNHSDTLLIASDGNYTFDNLMAAGELASVSIVSQPSGQVCDLNRSVDNVYGLANVELVLNQNLDIKVRCTTLLNKLGELASGAPTSITTNGSYAYLGTDNGLYAVDISMPSELRTVGHVQYNSSRSASDVVVKGNIVYAATEAPTSPVLQVIDVSNPAKPVIVRSIVFGNGARSSNHSISIDGNFLYITGNGSVVGDYLSIFDISIPDDPAIMGVLDIGASPNMVETQGGYAYIANNGLQIVDIKSPGNPAIVAEFSIPSAQGNQYQVAVSGQYAYLSDGKVLFVIDVTDPENPVQVATLSDPLLQSLDSIFISGGIAYVGRTKGAVPGGSKIYSLGVIDISDPAAPAIIDEVITTGLVRDIVVTGKQMFVAEDEAGIEFIDVSTPAVPIVTSRYDTPSKPNGIAVVNDLIYVADGYVTTIIDASDLSSLKTIGTFSGSAHQIEVSNGYAYMGASGQYSPLAVFDVSNPQAPSLVSDSSIPELYLFDVSGNYLYSVGGRLQIIDITNPFMPFEVSSTDFETQPALGPMTDIEVINNVAYIGSQKTGLFLTVDVEDPIAPSLIGSYDVNPNSISFTKLTVQGDYAYLCVGNNDLNIIDISTPTSPQLAGVIPQGVSQGSGPIECIDVAVHGNYAYLWSEVGLRVFAISDKNNIVEVARYPYNVPLGLHSDKIVIANNKVYLAVVGHGVVVLELYIP